MTSSPSHRSGARGRPPKLSARDLADLDSFVTRAQRPKAKMALWEAHVFALLGRGLSYRKIADYLAEKGVTVRPDEVYKFVHRQKRAEQLAELARTAPPPVEPSEAEGTPAGSEPAQRTRPPAAAGAGVQPAPPPETDSAVPQPPNAPASPVGAPGPGQGPPAEGKPAPILPKLAWDPSRYDQEL